MPDAHTLQTAIQAVSAAVCDDYTRAAQSGDIQRRYRTALALDALRQLAGDLDTLHMIARELRA